MTSIMPDTGGPSCAMPVRERMLPGAAACGLLPLRPASQRGHSHIIGGSSRPCAGITPRALLILVAVAVASHITHAQFTGGSEDGELFASVMNSACPVLAGNPFGGGIAEGHAALELTNVECTMAAGNPFGGGIADGHADQEIINTTCTMAAGNPFGGGIADGHADQEIINTTCTMAAGNPFGGGIADGHADQEIINTACTMAAGNPFGGGNADGHAGQEIINTACTMVAGNPFGGGNTDGHSSTGRLVVNPLDCSILLPVELVAFKAECDDGRTIITWTTATESNNAYFTIGRSADGTIFQDIGTIEGAGNSTSAIDYAFTDTEPYSDITYYRLKQTDFDGSFELSDLIAIHCTGGGTSALVVHPNPVSDLLHIRITDDGGPWDLVVLNAQGALVHRGHMTGQTTYATEGLAPGIYVVQVSRQGEAGRDHHLSQRFIKN